MFLPRNSLIKTSIMPIARAVSVAWRDYMAGRHSPHSNGLTWR